MLFIVLRRVCLSSLYMGQWRMWWEVDSASNCNYKFDFVPWKLCLNLRSCKWLRPTCSLVISLILLRFSQLKALSGIDLIIFRILLLKALKIPTFRIILSRLSHSIAADGKKTNFWESYVSFWREVCFQSCYGYKWNVLKELIWKVLRIFIFTIF